MTTTIVIPAIREMHEPPNSTQSEDEFNTNADALLGDLPNLVDDLNDFGTALNSLGDFIEGVALVAAQSAGANRFIQGVSYDVGEPVYSPVNFQTYRAKVAIGTAAHRHWCIDILDVNGGSAISLQYIQVRTSAGGSNIASQATYTSSVAPSSGTLSALFTTTGSYFKINATSAKIYLHFPTPVSLAEIVVAVHMSLSWDTDSPRNFNLTCSDDDATYAPFAYFTNQTSWTAGQARTFTASVPGLLDPSADSTNWEKISGTTDADTVDGFHASQTPVAGQIPAIKGDSSLALPGFLTVNNVDSGNANGLDYIFRSSFTLTLTGFSSTAPAGTAYLTRINRLVFLDLPTLSGTSNLTTMTATGIPAEIRPLTASKIILARVQDAGSYSWGLATIQTNGTIIFAKDAANNVFTASGTKGVSQLSNVSYPL